MGSEETGHTHQRSDQGDVVARVSRRRRTEGTPRKVTGPRRGWAGARGRAAGHLGRKANWTLEGNRSLAGALGT